MKSNVKEIRLVRSEGPCHLTGVWHTFSTAEDLERWLISQEDTLPDAGYDKFKYTIEWENGDTYEGRLDVMHPNNSRYKVGTNQPIVQAKAYLEYLVANDTEYKDQAQRFLDNLNF